MWVLFDFVDLNVSHFPRSLDLSLMVALWRNMVTVAVTVGLMLVWLGPHPCFVVPWRWYFWMPDTIGCYQNLDTSLVRWPFWRIVWTSLGWDMSMGSQGTCVLLPHPSGLLTGRLIVQVRRDALGVSARRICLWWC